MRVSNTFDRMGTVPDEKIREENMEVLPIDNEKLERLIQLYMDWYDIILTTSTTNNNISINLFN